MSKEQVSNEQVSAEEKLRLNFNERSDFISPMEQEFPFSGCLWQYPERQPLEKLIAERFELSPKQVLCTNGGDEAIMILMRLIKETSQLILPLPAFSQYVWGVESWQLDAKLIPGQADLSIDIDATLQAMEDSPGSVTIITRPNNPSGEMISLESLIGLIEKAKETKGWLFLDEAYIEFSDEPSVAGTLLNRYDNLLVLRTLSKAYGLAGIRLGYVLGAEKLIAEFVKRCAPFNIAQPTLEIATKALAVTNLFDVKDYCQRIRHNRELLYKWLVENNITVLPSQANFLVLQLPEQQGQAVASFLSRNGILLRAFDSDDLDNCIRITIPYQLEQLQLLLQQALLPELICLDMDGVLIDTSGSYDATVIATVKEVSGQDITVDEIEALKSSGGYNNDWVVSQKLLQNRGIDMELDAVIDIFQKLYLGTDSSDSLVNTGLVNNEIAIIKPAFTAMIKQSDSPQFAIVTGRPLPEAKAGQKLIGLEQLDVISLDCVELAKPSPQGIERLQQKYSKLSWMCGDNPDDMQAAVASNSLAIGIRENNKDALYQAGADIVLNDINELEKWLCLQQ